MCYKSLRYCCVYSPAPVMCNNSGSVAVPQKDIITVKLYFSACSKEI